MSVRIEKTVLGPRLLGPETETRRSARVELKAQKGKMVLAIGSRGYGGCDIETALSYARELIECVEAIHSFEAEQAITDGGEGE